MKPRTTFLLHGAGQNPPSWQDVVTRLGGERSLVAPWLKGLKPTQGFSFDLGAAVGDLATQVETRGLDRVDLVGNTLGGIVALRFAAELPDRVGRLVLVNTPVMPSRGVLRVQRALTRLMPESRFTEAGVTKRAVMEALRAMGEANLSVDLGAVRAPVLAVVGSGDQMASASVDLLRQAIPDLRVESLAGTDLLRDQPAALADLVAEFLATDDEPDQAEG